MFLIYGKIFVTSSLNLKYKILRFEIIKKTGMKKIFQLIFTIFFFNLSFYSQENDSIPLKYQDLDDVYTNKNYWKQYNYYLNQIRKVYPLALYAAKKIKEIDEELALIESKRKKKKVGKEANKELKIEFTYVVSDLYTSEGNMLMKLIHRETGMTVAEIIEKYRGKFKAELSDNLGKIWDQDLNLKYDPKKEWILENVIKDIHKKKVAFDLEPKIVSKEEYKDGMKQYRIDKKEAKKAMRAKRKSGS
jgi:hypothetical protein